tara:strand:+ start:243 stop:677 length:435 start_codon:yes stop_codon:yes gene_type:complete
MKNFAPVGSLVLLLALSVSQQAYSDNPFGGLQAPAYIEQDPTSTKEPDPNDPPLQRWPVRAYVLMGLLIADTADQKNQIAILRTPAPHSRTYMVRNGDLLGDQDGFIKAFDHSGLIVIQRTEDDDASEEVRLAVRNRGMRKAGE